MMPGIGNTVTIMLVYPLLLNLGLFDMLLFYIALCSISQYIGSVVATTLAIPGEASSLPAVKEGNALFKRGLGSYAISSAALGSLVGAMITVCIVWVIMPYAVDLVLKFYNNNTQFILLSVVCLFLLIKSKNKIIHNCLLFTFGWILSRPGDPSYVGGLVWEHWLPYDLFPGLQGGLPLFPVIVSLFVVPILANNWNPKIDMKDITAISDNKILVHIKEYWKYITSSLRGTLVGSIAGLVPHLTTILASNLAYVWEKSLRIRSKKYNKDGDLPSLISAETANNSAAFTQLMPLLLLGIPITASEAIILQFLSIQFIDVNFETTIQSGLFNELILWFVLINLMGFLIAWPFAKHIHKLYRVPVYVINTSVLLLLTWLCFYIGTQWMEGLYYLGVLFVLAPIGFFLRKFDTLVIIFAFILQSIFEGVIIRVMLIWAG
jgi:putative tricarboxylic transport membrane protein